MLTLRADTIFLNVDKVIGVNLGMSELLNL